MQRQKAVNKVGDRHTMACGCEIIRGEVCGKVVTNGKPIHEVIVNKCPKCRLYNSERTKIADATYEDFCGRGLTTKKNLDHSRAYLDTVEKKCAEAGLV